jgi:hypothetical protein
LGQGNAIGQFASFAYVRRAGLGENSPLPLRSEFDADDFLRNMASVASKAAGCEYAVTFQRFTVG